MQDLELSVYLYAPQTEKTSSILTKCTPVTFKKKHFKSRKMMLLALH